MFISGTIHSVLECKNSNVLKGDETLVSGNHVVTAEDIRVRRIFGKQMKLNSKT